MKQHVWAFKDRPSVWPSVGFALEKSAKAGRGGGPVCKPPCGQVAPGHPAQHGEVWNSHEAVVDDLVGHESPRKAQ